ncbi:hypothetical protein Pmani_010579 [Petrolisthes manimaculis]|uniref:Uncharacterized protein n=1 Tax=Petrolisthes manimaculis TaxID=1843537 RepID=A0AAE1UGK4_9EUCA|nr:hypothetical protein Pmani_010579 [Petrolisthes manimaculis]
MACVVAMRGDNKSSSTVAPFGASHSTSEVRSSSTQGNVHKSSYSTSFSTSSSSSTTGNRSYITKTESKKVSPFEKFKQLDAQAPRPASRE